MRSEPSAVADGFVSVLWDPSATADGSDNAFQEVLLHRTADAAGAGADRQIQAIVDAEFAEHNL